MLGVVPGSFARLRFSFFPCAASCRASFRGAKPPILLRLLTQRPYCLYRRFLSTENIASFACGAMSGKDKKTPNAKQKDYQAEPQKGNDIAKGDRSDDPGVEILEKGEIFFFYRPKVEREHPESMDDVQRMYMVIKPETGKRREMVKQAHESGKEGSKVGDETKDENSGTINNEKEEKGIVRTDETKDKPSEMGRHNSRETGDHTVNAVEKDDSHANHKSEAHKKNTHEHKKQSESSSNSNIEKNEEHGTLLGSGKEGGRGEEKVDIEKQQLFRFIILGRKSLPDASKRTRPYWGFVELVTTKLEDIRKALGPEEYNTATRGERHIPAARPAGEGRFCIVKHRKGRGNRSHTHLAYKLELPRTEKSDSPQSELNIEDEGSYIIQVKNPNQAAPPNVGLGNKRKALYPAYLQSAMGHYRFVPLDPCDFLNFEGCEFILISASDDLEKELGLQLDAQHDESCSVLLNLSGKTGDHEYVKPLLEGEWA